MRFISFAITALFALPASAQYYGSGMGGPAYSADASTTTYTPATAGDWDSVPTLISAALDELASRIAAAETAAVQITDAADGEVYIRSGAIADGIAIGSAVGNLVSLEDVGGSPGLPAVDGTQLTGLVSIAAVADGDVYQRSGAGVAGVTLGALATGASAADVPYTPANGAHWTDPDPDDAAEGLDDAIARVVAHEAASVDITDVADGDVYQRSGAGVAGVTLGALATNTVNDFAADATPDSAADYVLSWDTSAGAHKKVLMDDLPATGGGHTSVATEPTGTGVSVYSRTAANVAYLHEILGGDGISASLVSEDVVVSADINGLVADATPDGSADYVMTYDASAVGLKKVLLNDLPGGGGGETNTASTEGAAAGAAVFSQKVGVDLRFHGITGGDGIAASLVGEDVDVDLSINELTEDTAPDGTADFLVFYDTSAGTHDKVKPDDLPSPPTLRVSAYYAGAGDATDTSCAGSTTTAIVYDTESYDAGGDYNNTTGVITIPRDGFYCFSSQINHSGNTILRPVIQLDTGGGYADVALGTDAGTTPDENTGAVTHCASLSSGDLIRFACDNKNATSGRIRGTAYNTDNLTHMSAWEVN